MSFVPAGALTLAALSAAAVPVLAHAKTYATVAAAQQAMFGTASMTPVRVLLTAEQQAKLREASSVSLPFQGDRVWKTGDGGWFVVDEVVGKHEMITYAVGIDAAGAVRQIAVLEYQESYGSEVADAKWRQQFVGKTAASPLKLERDIENLAGATLSAKHLTDGVKRVMTMYELVLRHGK
ncbi:FMN-binding protein [Duganella sp. FT80W]|uniref:FMN-binding protein n=1 Tax=Duganella guangzhouensis TaxID=2666084 RepID=A0A6I2KZK5_9BURK|nr:FMN-binding protein [Duganella guangzhouensis]MRW89914.1 FMN-binding protein [Duganella guangzhouensis]